MNNYTIKSEIASFRMSFLPMVVFIAKAAIAPIPALVILMFIGALTFGALAGLMGGFGGF